MEWITDKNTIRTINTMEVKLSKDEIRQVFINGLLKAFKESSDTCYTKLLLSLNKALDEATEKPIINR